MEDEEITISFKVKKSQANDFMKYVKTLPDSEQTSKPTTFAKKLFLKFAEGFGKFKPSKVEIE